MSIIPFKMNKFILIIILVFFAACQNSEDSNRESRSSTSGRMEHHRKRIRGKHQPVESNNILATGDTVFVPLNSPVSTKFKLHTIDYQEYLGLVEDAGKILQGRIYSYQHGESGLIDVLNAQRTYIELQLNHVEALFEYTAALIEFERAAGIWDLTK